MTLQQQNDMMRAALESLLPAYSHRSTVYTIASRTLAACPPLPAPGEDERAAFERAYLDFQGGDPLPVGPYFPLGFIEFQWHGLVGAMWRARAALAAKPSSAPPAAREFDALLETYARRARQVLQNNVGHEELAAAKSKLDAHCAKLVAAAEADAEITENSMLDTMRIQLATIERLQAKLAARAEPDTTALHRGIMNIPCKRADSEFSNVEDRLLYKEGHRDARHAAAELVNEFGKKP